MRPLNTYKGYVVEYYLEGDPHQTVHREAVEEAKTPQQAIKFIEFNEGRGFVVGARAYPIH